jgi:hypothetical protein
MKRAYRVVGQKYGGVTELVLANNFNTYEEAAGWINENKDNRPYRELILVVESYEIDEEQFKLEQIAADAKRRVERYMNSVNEEITAYVEKLNRGIEDLKKAREVQNFDEKMSMAFSALYNISDGCDPRLLVQMMTRVMNAITEREVAEAIANKGAK